MNSYILIKLRWFFTKGLSIHTREYATPHPQRCGSTGAMTRRRRARRETDSRKRWLFFGSRHVYRAAIAFLILFLLNPAEGSAWFTSAPPCRDNFQLTRASYTTGSKQFEYKWKGTCWHPCAESYSSVTVEASYDGAKQKAAEELTFTGGVPCKVQITMSGCLYNPFIDFPIKGIPDGCGNRLAAVDGCDEAYSLVPDSGFITEGMVPRDVTDSSGGSPPPPPPPPRPKGAYEVKQILSPAGRIGSQYTEITFALEPRLSNWPPNRIVAHWELAPENMYQQSKVQLKKETGVGPKATVGWNYYEKVPTAWNEFPRKFPISFFPSRKETYRVRVYAETPDGKWLGPTEWSYFSFASPIQESQNQFPQPPPPMADMADLTVEDFIPWSQTSWQDKTGWRLRWKFKNVGKKVVIDPKYRIQCDVITGSGAHEEMCTKFERLDILPGYLFPDQTIDSPATDVVYEPDSEELFKLRITAIIDPEDEISEGVLGEINNKLVSYIQNSKLLVQQKPDFPVQTQASNQYASKEAKIITGKGEEKGSGKLEKGGGFVPKSDEKTMQTKQGESSLGPEGLQAQKMQGGKKIVKGEKQAVPGGAVVVQKKVIKKPLGLELPELEIKVNSKPAQVCPDKNYNVNITIINHSNLKARFNLCSVGSHTYKCDLGQPPVHEINGKATRSLSMSIRPAAAFVDKGKWHGKVFLGKVKSQTNENELLQVGDNQPKEPSDCNVGVSTSWSGGAGFIAGILFCDKNMDNNLVKLEINSSSALCNPKLIKKMDTEKGSEASKKKTVIKPEIEDKGPESNSGKIIKEPGIQLK